MQSFTASTWLQRLVEINKPSISHLTNKPILIFVAGDRSQVGKSSSCLGLIGTLHEKLGYLNTELAYIKPATQCEGTQLITRYCNNNNITNVGIGPVVFYSGFTRSFLAGEQGTSESLLNSIETAVKEISHGKKIIIVDGVGYPAVGSICGISNAAVAKRLNAPVILIGKKGVGDAIDSYNLNSTFFEHHKVKVLGSIFNRLPIDEQNYYSLSKCRTAIVNYFQQYKNHQMPYGFVPEIKEMGMKVRDEIDEIVATNTTNTTDPTKQTNNNEEMSNEITYDEQSRILISVFSETVDVERLVKDAEQAMFEGNHRDDTDKEKETLSMLSVASSSVTPSLYPSNSSNSTSSSSSSSTTNTSSSSKTTTTKRKSRDEVTQIESSKGAKRTK